MARYSVVGEDTNTASATIPNIYAVQNATLPRRMKLYEIIIGSDAVAADNAFQYAVRRLTDENASPGGSSVTPFPLDEGDPASVAHGQEAPTGAPTYATGTALEIGLNQRSTFRWVASPGSELVSAAAEDNGWAILTEQAASAVVANFTMMWEE